MQTFSLDTPVLWRRIGDWAHRPAVDSLITLMQNQGYGAKSVYCAVRIAGHFVEWLNHKAKRGDCVLDYADVERFIAYRAAIGKLRYGERRALRQLRAELVNNGVIAAPPSLAEPQSELLALYAEGLQRRGYRDTSIASHLWFCTPFLRAAWVDGIGIAQLSHQDVRNYIERRATDRGTVTAKIMCSRIRVFLRFLWSGRHIADDLAASIPAARSIRLTSLPSHMNPCQLEQVLSACDRATIAGRRDYAILLLLARLGLRANEAACLSLDDIDWRAGTIQIHGKGGQTSTMPLPQDVGEAIADYCQHGRPPSGARTIFHRLETPRTPFVSAAPVSLLAHRALKRSGVTGLGSGYSHVFRHTLATQMIRSGASLTEIGQVLRHQEPNTSRIYAKVDVEKLRALSLPWLGGVR